MRKTWLAPLFAALTAAGLAFATPATAQTTLKMAYALSASSHYGAGGEAFSQTLDAGTAGRYKVQQFPSSALGGEREVIEGLQLGTIDLAILSTGATLNFVPQTGVFDIPFLMRDLAHARQVLDGPIGQDMLKAFSARGLEALAWGEQGFRHLTNSKRAVVAAADAKGLKIRTTENPVHITAFRQIGILPTPMAWPEVATALQQGTIDGQENPVNVIHSFKLDETQNYMTLSRHTYAPAIFVMGMPAWNQLPEAAQDVIRQAAQEAAEHERQVNADMEAEQLAALREAGMEINDSPDMEAFQAAVAPVYEKYGQQFGDYLPRIQEALNQ